MIHYFFWKRGIHDPDVFINSCVTQLLRLYVLCFSCRGHRDNSSQRRYNLMWSTRTTIKALRGTGNQRITYSSDTSNTSRQNSNSKNHGTITPFKMRQCKDYRNLSGLKAYMLRKYGIKVILQEEVPEQKRRGHGFFFSLPILVPCGKIRVPWSWMRNHENPITWCKNWFPSFISLFLKPFRWETDRSKLKGEVCGVWHPNESTSFFPQNAQFSADES